MSRSLISYAKTPFPNNIAFTGSRWMSHLRATSAPSSYVEVSVTHPWGMQWGAGHTGGGSQQRASRDRCLGVVSQQWDLGEGIGCRLW